MAHRLVTFFDKLEDKTRAFFSKRPILYAIVTSFGIILVWRGIWHTADLFAFMSGPLSFFLGTLILLMTGVFVSSFISNKVILTGLRGEKKLTEMTGKEVDELVTNEHREMKSIEKTLAHIEEEISELKGLKKD